MRYLIDHKITFIHNPKTAGTSICQWLDENYKTIKGRKHGHYKEVEEFFPETVYQFGVVRNPWTRLASWYKFAGRGISFKDWFYSRLNKTGSIGLSFSPQLPWALQWYNLGTPQADWFGDNTNAVLRFETLEKDFEQVQEILGCKISLSHVNYNSDREYSKLYDDEMIEVVREVYIKDVIKYNYDYPF